MKNNIPNEINEYNKIEKEVEKVINSPVLCRILFLIIDGINYNDALAKAYVNTNKNENKTILSNPKVMAIHLANLRQANVINRKEKEGRKQIYEVNWNGILNIIKFRNITKTEKKIFGLSELFYQRYGSRYSIKKKIKELSVGRKYNEGGIKKLTEEISLNLLKPFFEEYVWYTKNLMPFTTYFSEKKGTPWQREFTSVATKNFDNIDFNLLYLLEKFDKILIEVIPKLYSDLIKKSIKNKRLKQYFLYSLVNYYLSYEEEARMYYSENPEGIVLDRFCKLLSDIDKKEAT